MPNNWKAGRIWGRRDCDFSTNPGPNSCLTGGCNGGLVCDPNTGTVSRMITAFELWPDFVSQGVPPATVAEFTLTGDGNKDYYDGVSKFRC